MRKSRDAEEQSQKPEKFNYEKMKREATHDDSAIRKQSFIEYFNRFAEFPSYLFDNSQVVDERLQATIDDLLEDPETSRELRAGIELLMRRLETNVGL
jgi:hypothetical protein